MLSAVERTMNLFEISRKDAQAKMDLQISKMKGAVKGQVEYITSMKIEDRLISHKSLDFDVNGEDSHLCAYPSPMHEELRIHRHALSKVCATLKLPITYLDMLMKQGFWGQELAVRNLQKLMRETPFKNQKGEEHKFLLRVVDQQLRGFLSRSYGIHLSTNPLLMRFLEECAAKDAVPIETAYSDIRFHVKCALPYVYEVHKGQYVAVGLSFHNSDFGAGKFSLREAIWDPIHDRGAILGEADNTFIDKGLRDRIHLGPSLIDADMEPMGGTRAVRTEAVAKHMKDTVQAMFSPEWANQLCLTIMAAQKSQISWASIVRRTGAILLKEEVEQLKKLLLDGDPTLPELERDADGLPAPTMWWTASALSMIAAKTVDPERRIDLQEEAGKFIHKE